MRKSKKMYSGLALVIIISLSTLSLASCNNEESSLHRVMMLGSPDADVFDVSVKSFNVVGNKYQNEGADETKSIVLANGNQETVLYAESQKIHLGDTDVYRSESKNIICYYDSSSGQLTQIRAKNNAVPVPNNLSTESDYRNWVEQLLTVYGVNDLSSYRYSCATSVAVSNENSAYKDQYKYFYSDFKSNESLAVRGFYYIKYLGEYPTTDRIYVSISESIGSVLIKFDQHKFTDFTEANFDESTISAAVLSFIKNSMNTEKYEFVSMNIQDKTLTVIETELCLRVGVEVEFVRKNQPDLINPIGMLVDLLVYPE